MLEFFKNNKQNILQFTRLALISGLVFALFMAIVLSVLVWVYQDRVKESFVERINESLKTEIFVDDISLNVFRNFPLVSLTLSEVTMLGSTEARDTLLSARRVYFRFSLMDLIRQNYSVRQIEVARAKFDMKLFDDGSNNYTFWEVADEFEHEENDFNFQLQSVVFNQVEYRFQDYANNHTISLLLRKARMKGDFARDNYKMEFGGDLYLDHIIIGDAFLAGERNMTLDFDFNVFNNNALRVTKGLFTLGNHAFETEGILDFSSENAYIDLSVSGRQLKLDDFIKDLPPLYARYFDGYRSKGEFYFDALIKGDFPRPQLDAKFGIKKGEMFHRKANLRFENVAFDASFTNGSRRDLTTSRLEFSGLNAKLNKGELSGNGVWLNFIEPNLDFKLYSNISAGEWARFLQIDKISSASGDLLVDIEFRGKLGRGNSFTTQNFLESRVKGEIKARNLSLRLKNDPLDYNSVYADFLFNNNDILVDRFSGNASESNFEMNGYFRNVLPWLFLDNEKLLVDASLKSDNLNFNQLLQHNVSESDTIYRLSLSEKIEFNLKANIGKLSFRKFEAENVTGTLSMRDKVFFADNVSVSTMKGNIQAAGYINGKNDDFLIVGCDARFNRVDVYDLFYQMGNFGQQGIIDENLRGRITAQASFVSRWSPYLEIDWNSLETTADIKVEDGELINYKPMLALSRFIRVGDLNQVKFSTLENQIRIKDQKIIIPDMEINSNAINIKLSGEHTFNNEIEYRLQVLLSDLLARNNRQNRNPQEQYGDIIDDGLGRTTLFLLVSGNIDDPVFRYDRQGVREKLREDFRQERQNLRDVFRSEFGLKGSETATDDATLPPTQRQKEQNDIRKREKGKFVIEWDDD
jgi:hypothetical protein